MAPERRCNPADTDGHADNHPLGVIEFVVITGREVFDASDALSLTGLVWKDISPRVSKSAEWPITPEPADLIGRDAWGARHGSSLRTLRKLG